MGSSGFWRWTVDALLRPAQFLQSRQTDTAQSRRGPIGAIAGLAASLIVNYLAYVVPIAATWSIWGSGEFVFAVTSLTFPFLYLIGLVAWAFHAGLLVTGNASSLISSVRSTVVAIGVYLSIGLGFAFPILAGSETELGDFLRGATLFAFTFDGSQVARSPGSIELALGAVGAVYFTIAVFLITRTVYGTSRDAAAVVTAVTVGTPCVTGPLLYDSFAGSPPDLYLALVALVGAVLVAAVPLDVHRRIRSYT